MVEGDADVAAERKFRDREQDVNNVAACLDWNIRERMLGERLGLRDGADGTRLERQLADVMSIACDGLLDA